jgi:hypothetical protein
VPIAATSLFRAVGLEIAGTVAWGSRVPSKACGVYIVSLSENPSRSAGMPTPLQSRIGAYYATPLGNRGPHAGGHWVKTLAVLSETFVHYAEVADCEKAETTLLRAFSTRVSPATRQRIGEPSLPFANLEFPDGTRKQRKRHGIGKCKLPKA